MSKFYNYLLTEPIQNDVLIIVDNIDKVFMYQDKNSLTHFFKSFLQNEGSSLKTQKNYVTDLTDFFFFLERTKCLEGVSSANLHSINEQDIELYKQYLIGQKKSESTIQRRLSSLRTFFHACKRAHLVNHFPFPKQKNTPDTHPLLHVWKGHLQEKGLPVEMSDHVHEFLLWIYQKKKN